MNVTQTSINLLTTCHRTIKLCKCNLWVNMHSKPLQIILWTLSTLLIILYQHYQKNYMVSIVQTSLGGVFRKLLRIPLQLFPLKSNRLHDVAALTFSSSIFVSIQSFKQRSKKSLCFSSTPSIFVTCVNKKTTNRSWLPAMKTRCILS